MKTRHPNAEKPVIHQVRLLFIFALFILAGLGCEENDVFTLDELPGTAWYFAGDDEVMYFVFSSTACTIWEKDFRRRPDCWTSQTGPLVIESTRLIFGVAPIAFSYEAEIKDGKLVLKEGNSQFELRKSGYNLSLLTVCP